MQSLLLQVSINLKSIKLHVYLIFNTGSIYTKRNFREIFAGTFSIINSVNLFRIIIIFTIHGWLINKKSIEARGGN
jgi:hypothetical protein